MPTAARRNIFLSLFLSVGLCALLALAGCGTNSPKACNEAGCCPPGDACVAPLFLYSTGISGQVSAFHVNPSNGALSALTSIAGPVQTFGMAALNNQFLYVSSPDLTLGGTSSIDAWSITPGTGALQVVPGSPFNLEPFSVPGGLAVNPAAQVLYVANAGRIDALKADATGALTALPQSPFTSGANLFLTIDPGNHFVFASDFDPPGSVFAFTIDSTGSLSPVANSPFPTIPNFVGDTQPTEIVVDSTGNFVYTALRGTGQVAAFSIVPASGALNPVPGSPFPAGNGPFSMTTTRNFLYVSNVLDGTVSGYSITPSTGVLQPLANSPFPIHAGAMTTVPFGGYLYTEGPGGITAFSIDPNSGALTVVSGSPFPDNGATVLTVAE